MDEVRRYIKREVNTVFSSKLSDIELDDVINLFINFIKYPINDFSSNLDGLEIRLLNSIVEIFKESSNNKDLAFSEFVKFEPYLRKILYIVNKNELAIIEAGKKGLFPLIKSLNLNPESKNFSSLTPISFTGQSHYIEHLCRAYHLRNKECHHCINFSQTELAINIQSVLVVYLHATFLHYSVISKTIDIYGINRYLEREIDNFKQWKDSFVHIDGKESFEIDIYAKEMYLGEKTNDSPIERLGTINFLRHDIKEKQMVILGEVGIGKSTTLQYIHYKDAEICYLDNSKPIPVYIELKYLSEDQGVMQKIISKLAFDEDYIIHLLNKGRFVFFMDGLNEIGKTIKNKIFRQIDGLIKDYPLNQIIITSRPLSYHREFDGNAVGLIPVFLLQTMQDNQIEEFLLKNGDDVKDKILSEIRYNNKIKEIVTNPFFLKMLINVVRRTNIIPTNKVLIIKEFISNILRREKKVADFDEELYYMLLANWGYQSRILTNSNTGLSQMVIATPFFKNLKDKLGTPNLDVWEFFKQVRNIHLLTKENDLLSFTHELYQEYFAADFLYRDKFSVDYADKIKRIIKDPNWSEVVILYSGLFSSLEERTALIKEITLTDPYLALRCENSCFNKNNELELFIIKYSTIYLNSKEKIEKQLITSSIQALLGLNQYKIIIDFVKGQTGSRVPRIKSVVYNVLSKNIKHDDLWKIIKVFFDANSHYFILEINLFLVENGDEIHLKHDIIRDIINDLLNSDVKTHHVIKFLRFYNFFSSDSIIEIEKSYILNALIQLKDINDVFFMISFCNVEIASTEIIKTIIQKGETQSLFMLVYYMNRLQQNSYKEEIIKKLLDSKQKMRIALGIVFMVKYHLVKIFKSRIFSDRTSYNRILMVVNRILNKKDINIFLDFISILNVTRVEMDSIIKNADMDKLYNKEFKCKVITELPYHYLLSQYNINAKILLPKNEIENNKLKIHEKIVVYTTFVDKKRNRLYVSLNEKSCFKSDYQYILRENDIIECKITIHNDKYYINSLALGSKLLKYKIDSSKQYVHTRNYKAKVKSISNYDNIELDIFDE